MGMQRSSRCDERGYSNPPGCTSIDNGPQRTRRIATVPLHRKRRAHSLPHASLSSAAVRRNWYSNGNTATTMISSMYNACCAHAGNPGVASRMTEATLSTISVRIRFSNAPACCHFRHAHRSHTPCAHGSVRSPRLGNPIGARRARCGLSPDIRRRSMRVRRRRCRRCRPSKSA
jgi:hypothetical protein